MTRPIIIILIFSTTVFFKTFGQVTAQEKEILENVTSKSKTCDKLYYTSKTDTFFIKEFQKFLKENSYYYDNKKTHKLSLTKSDKIKILKELDECKNLVWTDNSIFPNSQIVSNDSIFNIDNYLDTSCLRQLTIDKKNVKVISFSKPIYFDKGNSFIIYTIEIGVLTKFKSFYYADSKLLLFKKTNDGKWIKSGNLFSSFACNG